MLTSIFLVRNTIIIDFRFFDAISMLGTNLLIEENNEKL